MGVREQLRAVGLFAELSEDDLSVICDQSKEVQLAAGDDLFAEGDDGDWAYVISSGELDVVKATEGKEIRLAVRGPGEVIGEMSLLQAAPRIATCRARKPTELIAIPKEALDRVLDTSTAAARAMMNTLLARMQETNEQLRHSERMAQLGTLTAGVAHELNNPAAAVARAAKALADTYAAAGPSRGQLPPTLAAAVDEVVSALGGSSAVQLSPLDRADAEEALEDWLDEHGVDDAWQLASDLVGAGVDATALTPLVGVADADTAAISAAVRHVATEASVRGLVHQIGEGANRLSGIVGALKGYSYLDQAPEQDVDVIAGLEDTLVMLGHQVRSVELVREFEEVPTIIAMGSELNQVWTNLIANAVDAMVEAEVEAPRITLRVRHDQDDDGIVVEVEDNGTGIPPDIQPKVFDSFFTTKPPGKGTGLGLQISRRIIVLEHNGDLTLDSEPGRTTFRAWLPISGGR